MHKVLFLSQTLPYPPDSGVNVRTFNVLKGVASAFDVHCLCFARRAVVPDPSDLGRRLQGLRGTASGDGFFIPSEWSLGRKLATHASSVMRTRVYTWFEYSNAEYLKRMRSLLSTGQFGLVHIDSLDLARFAKVIREEFPTLPIACSHHNVESELLLRRSRVVGSPFVRMYLRHQARLYARLEREWLARFALNVAVSDRDAEILKSMAPDAGFLTIPNGVDTEFFSVSPQEPEGGMAGSIVFLGGTDWFPNYDALAHFARDVLPILRGKGYRGQVYWVGRSTEAHREEFSESGVELTGFVDDIRPIVQGAACSVVPLRVGGGTRLKITTAWAMGAAIVSTSQGCEGLDARDGENLLVADTPERFADAVMRILVEDGLRRRLQSAARRTAEESYSWNVVLPPMIDAYRNQVRPAHATGS